VAALALVLFFLALPVFLFFVTPLGSLSSRKHEFEADAFAASHTDARELVNALVKLYEADETMARLVDARGETVGLVTAQALRRDFGIAKPRLAVAALNPHAGEGGALGREESEIVAPAVRALEDLGVDVSGPHPADTPFPESMRSRYDAAICLYHDQALIPVKMLDFWGGVNLTLGLPVVRASPDHGTALDIAGKGLARADSLIAALRLAAAIAARRMALARA